MTTPMTPEETALRAAFPKMSDAPWSVSGVSTVRSADDSMAATFVDYTQHEADAEGMCAARNALPALLKELDALRVEVQQLKAAADAADANTRAYDAAYEAMCEVCEGCGDMIHRNDLIKDDDGELFCRFCLRLNEPNPELPAISTLNEPRRYLTDDADISDPMELELFMGGNGDWYMSVLPKGDRLTRHCVRVTTSGSKCPGAAVALARLYRALPASP